MSHSNVRTGKNEMTGVSDPDRRKRARGVLVNLNLRCY
jgi:hypothetical protein